jgi:hypothetical protein
MGTGSMSEPSFAQLFRRSRYARIGPSASDEKAGQQQQRLEIFAVAAVGFALQHDPEFKNEFLKRIDPELKDAAAFKPILQASHWADLKLEDRNGDALVVVEFKVGADLEKKQDPWAGGNLCTALPEFWSEQGYGFQLLKDQTAVRCRTIYYVVVQQAGRTVPREDSNCTRNDKTFSLRSRSWKNLLLEPYGNLGEDLVNSLGELGIPELEDWRMTQDDVESNSVEACLTAGQRLKCSKQLRRRQESESSSLYAS